MPYAHLNGILPPPENGSPAYGFLPSHKTLPLSKALSPFPDPRYNSLPPERSRPVAAFVPPGHLIHPAGNKSHKLYPLRSHKSRPPPETLPLLPHSGWQTSIFLSHTRGCLASRTGLSGKSGHNYLSVPFSYRQSPARQSSHLHMRHRKVHLLQRSCPSCSDTPTHHPPPVHPGIKSGRSCHPSRPESHHGSDLRLSDIHTLKNMRCNMADPLLSSHGSYIRKSALRRTSESPFLVFPGVHPHKAAFPAHVPPEAVHPVNMHPHMRPLPPTPVPASRQDRPSPSDNLRRRLKLQKTHSSAPCDPQKKLHAFSAAAMPPAQMSLPAPSRYHIRPGS